MIISTATAVSAAVRENYNVLYSADKSYFRSIAIDKTILKIEIDTT